MNTETYFQKLLRELHAFSHIPTYFYQNGNLLSCEPETASNYLLTDQYLNMFSATQEEVCYLMTNFHCFYGCVQHKETGTMIIAGPINTIPYTKRILQELGKTFLRAENEYENFSYFLTSIPPTNLNNFISYLSLLQFTVNHNSKEPANINYATAPDYESIIHEHYANAQYSGKETEVFNNSFELERRFLSYVEAGDIAKIHNFFTESFLVSTGIVADNNLRQKKNELIITVTLCCRAAIRGGLPTDIAFNLSDAYIQQIEAIHDPLFLLQMSRDIILEYTERVAANATPIAADNIIQKAIQYVQQNTNRHISVTDVANAVGFSRAYLSHKFKETLGFDLSAFINRCKLEESRELLRYTNKSISEISNYLCFSSQSYFQNCFKKQYGITPQKYRNGQIN